MTKVKIKTSAYNVPALERGLEVLELLSRHSRGLNQTEIAAALKSPLSSIFRITMTLVEYGFLERDQETKVFRLTQKMLIVGQRTLGEPDLIGQAMAVMRDLRDIVKDTILLGVLNETEIIVLDQVLGTHLFRFSVNAGHRIPVYCSAPGKAILAFLPEKQCESVIVKTRFVRHNENTIVTPEAFRHELTMVAKRGYAVDRGEEYAGIYCVSAPIFDRNGYPIAAIWVTGPDQHVRPEDIPGIGKQLREHASQISARLGFVS
jgi:DNA-binding IclR family transcriptional regulator